MNEVCPCCGDFVKSLWEITGWCSSCSIKHGRECTGCNVKQPFENFTRDKTRKDGRRPRCKTCDDSARRARSARARRTDSGTIKA